MSIRLSKVTKECNVGLQTVVEFLQKKGFGDVEASPNSKISEEQYELLATRWEQELDSAVNEDISNWFQAWKAKPYA